MKLEDLTPGALIEGLDPKGPAKIISLDWMGGDAINVIYRVGAGGVSETLLTRTNESLLSVAEVGLPWAFDAPGDQFILGVEASRIQLAHLFDPMMAVHSSNVEPLPHQISAVYEAMLPKQPLRFVLADDPGAGKTIMAGLLIKELILRADAKRILIVSPGSLSGQWQDELREKFDLNFKLFSRDGQEHSPTGNLFLDEPFLIARLDQLSRNDELQQKLEATHWDLIIVDEAHKLSAHYFNTEIQETKRFKLGKLLGGICRHFLLMTATPHNGKEEDYQLFLSLLDGDRFYGKFREGVHKVETSDLMRRMVKEELLRFDGTRLFPERRAYTANYKLSNAEAALYEHVTSYVREEMNRAEQLDGKRKGTVGFALTMLQRRLASSPEAIFQSIHRRRKRLEAKLEEEKLLAKGRAIREDVATYKVSTIDVPDNLDEADDELSAEEFENYADAVVDQASAAKTIVEMQAEIFSLKSLEEEARAVVASSNDSKWNQLSAILQDRPEMRDSEGNRRKLIIFTEHRDTLNYLALRIANLIGDPESVATIHGGTNRDERRKTQELFRQDKRVLVLIATDAAGEGVNLQNANLMVNYDLPWNPNRLEQRFGRIHRIGQREVCHLWNLVANETREGEVFQKLLDKIENAKAALGGRVFDVLGEAFEGTSLRELLVEAIRYGNLPETKAKLYEVIDNTLDVERLKQVMKQSALHEQHMGLDQLYAIKEEMDRAEARKLQPHFIRGFFSEAFKRLGGEMRARESGRFEIPFVPAPIREADRMISQSRTPVLRSYNRICFEKADLRPDGTALADLIHPGHPLMAAVIDQSLEVWGPSLRKGTVLVDADPTVVEPYALVMVDHAIRERADPTSNVISRRIQFVRLHPDGRVDFAGWAPHLDLRPLDEAERANAQPLLEAPWLKGGIEHQALSYAASQLAPDHIQEVSARRLAQADRLQEAVRKRLGAEINHLTHRAQQLKLDVQTGKQPKMQPDMLMRRAEELAQRLKTRLAEIEGMRHVAPQPPSVIGGALVVPKSLLSEPGAVGQFTADAAARARIEALAMKAVMAAETAKGYSPKDVSAEKCGWDITSRVPSTATTLTPDRLIEVKGRAKGATTLTLTKNEIMAALNKKDQFLLAIVLINEDDSTEGPFYVREPVTQAPDWAEESKNLSLAGLLQRAGH